jgi:folate-binding protein YgfZ
MTAHPVTDASFSPLDDAGLLSFEGPDARAFLQGQLSNDVEALAQGRGQWTSYNSPKGRVLANFWLWQAPGWPGLERYDAWIAGDLASAMQKRLSMFVLRSKVKVLDRTADHHLFGVWGRGANAAIGAAFGRAPVPAEAIVADGISAQIVALPDGRHLVSAAADVAALVAQRLAAHAGHADIDGWYAAGITAGVPWITAATSDHFVAQMINWDALAGVSFQKGCYPGQEVVARMRYLGRLKERLFRLSVFAPAPAPGTRLFSPVFGDSPCGTVVNAAPAAEHGRSEFLAVVQLTAVDAPKLTLGTPDGAAAEPLPLPYGVPDVAPPRRVG